MFRNLRLLSALPSLALTSVSALAEEKTASERFRIYGQFSPSILSFGDGVGRHTDLVDNSASVGRIGLWYEVPGGPGRTRLNLESSLWLRSSATLSQSRVPPLIEPNTSTLRKFEIIHDTERFGSFSFGIGSMGSDSVTESDLSGTRLASHVAIRDTAGGYFFRTGSGALSTVQLASAFPTFDGGRAPRIRWDSPDLALDQLGTFNLAVSFGVEVSGSNIVVNESLADIGVFYQNTLGDFELKASAGSSVAQVGEDEKPQLAGSISLLHKSGWSITAASGARQDGGEYVYAKIGLNRRWFEQGETNISIDVYHGADTVLPGSSAESYGIGIVQDIDRSDLQFYLGWRRYRYDEPETMDYRPASSIIFGTRWVFKRLENLKRNGRSEVDWQEQ